ncbi:hypothetical protein KHS38_18595 [Mucilaginibacter sp. Bleaf8]|uniref:hypothetical protein n=1 Tax=Mucilaginibacter sp. Bleaf8 TaxID=2834430 RepID=UPI001BCA9E34|nr:hypothetical protein [Mucilaginibacter sp. Bleaf8]MBS7566425.1 hypothetical protein [Mucilaginibacter sp. Bleaf8]
MDNLNDLKALWLTAKTDDLPTSAEMLQIIKKFRQQRLKKKRLVIILAGVTALSMVAVMLFHRSQLFTTWAGEVLIILSSLALMIDNIRSMKRFQQLDNCSNKEFVSFIEKTRQNQLQYYKKKEYMIMLPCCIGWLLYLYEIVIITGGLFMWVYVPAVIYLLVIWLWVRPYTFKKDAKKLNAIEERLKNIHKQLE